MASSAALASLKAAAECECEALHAAGFGPGAEAGGELIMGIVHNTRTLPDHELVQGGGRSSSVMSAPSSTLAALNAVAALCAFHAPDFSMDEAAACLTAAEGLIALFRPPRCYVAQLPQAAVQRPIAANVLNGTESPSATEEVIGHAVATVDTGVVQEAAVCAQPHGKHTRRVAAIPVIPSPAQAARSLILDQLDLARKELVGVTDLIRKSTVPHANAMAQGLARVTLHTTEAFDFSEDWLQGVPSTIVEDMTFPSPEACAAYMGHVSEIGTEMQAVHWNVGWSAASSSSEAAAAASAELQPVLVGNDFACPFADPITFVCKIGRRHFRPQRLKNVFEHMVTQRKRHYPAETNGFVHNTMRKLTD